ncbi:hypothetical protein P691DRAFT_779356 [Macrolepiota fuliginosa MF-IS2]|uniref:Uncharacterized protein n=1 Tax=Macrolepiota fuliginosa MF-IS2 TaxID=1400762 RepID=A0A9P6BX18_9AGAR|nr:hypothetical protein P691DRAFT_779356 [Macrolepiota fuliginosa MF-IS2]
MSRQQLRRHRLLELEKEQHLEDAEDLVMTEEQRQLLLSPFMSVKFEFHDLDGMRWTQTALRDRQCRRRPSVLPSYRSNCAFVVLANTHCRTHDLEATIRGSMDRLSFASRRLPKLEKQQEHRPSIASKRFWCEDSELDILASSFPLPPSTVPPLFQRKSAYTLVGGLGFASPIVDRNRLSIPHQQPLSSSPPADSSGQDDFFYDTLLYTTTLQKAPTSSSPNVFFPRSRWAQGLA